MTCQYCAGAVSVAELEAGTATREMVMNSYVSDVVVYHNGCLEARLAAAETRVSELEVAMSQLRKAISSGSAQKIYPAEAKALIDLITAAVARQAKLETELANVTRDALNWKAYCDGMLAARRDQASF